MMPGCLTNRRDSAEVRACWNQPTLAATVASTLVFALLLAAAPPAHAAKGAAVAKPAAAKGAAPIAPAKASAKVTYLSGTSVYVEAGSKDGLAVGDTLTVVRQARSVAWLRVAFLASHRAACDTLRTLTPVAIGDVALFTPRPVAPTQDGLAAADSAGAAGGALAAQGRGRKSATLPRVQGRVGLAYLLVDTQGSGKLSQLGFDVRLDGTQMWGAPVDVAVDLRARRTSFQRVSGATTSDNLSRFHRFSLTAHDTRGRYLVTLGRQSAAALSPVSLFDGGLAEFRGERFGTGVFVGAQPEPLHLGLSSDIVEAGGFVEWHQAPMAERRWSVANGVVFSQQGGMPNRDFLFTQGSYMYRALSVFAAQEVDINRGWRRAPGQSVLSITSSFLTVNVRASQALSVRGGYDNRRNVRLYRDRETPETEFDDRYRQGGWVGVSAEPLSHLRVGGDVRTSAIGGAERFTSGSASAEVHRIGRVNGALRARYSRASGSGVITRFSSFGLGLDPVMGCHLEFAGGSRTTENPLVGVNDNARWESADLDLVLMRRGYLNLSVERNHGGLTPSTQARVGLSWRY
ncbi:MAG: hypothetical protein HZB25_14380 [Candidatus Eisenbacteria bacterium]|nr:hypothetical protein [Candidatus Eisenbacteria bacterium]